MRNQKKGYFDSDDTFGRDELPISETHESDKTKGKSIFEDICDLCGVWTPNLWIHLKAFHPKIYNQMIES